MHKAKLSLRKVWTLLVVCAASNVAFAGPISSLGASYEPAATVTDFYAFRSWEDPSKVVFILNVMPGQHPGDGPLYYNFSSDVKYRINIDNNLDGIADDVIYEFSFQTENRPLDGKLSFPLSYVGNPLIQSRPELNGITALDGSGSEGITLRQKYRVVERGRGHGKTSKLFSGQTLVAVPSNVGPVTMPDYESLAAQGIYVDSTADMRVFAGQRADSFFADTGALFDGAAPRRLPPILSPQEEASNSSNPFGTNSYAGRNVHSIALEVPISRVISKLKGTNKPTNFHIGAYASTVRQIKGKDQSTNQTKREYEQVSRLGNPLTQTFIIDVKNKEAYSHADPAEDRRFAALFSDPPLARPPTSEIFGVPVPPAPRVDLISLFLKYPNQAILKGACGSPCADLLRLDLSVPPTPPESQNRMGALLGNDPAGVPNGRRPGDDVVDFIVRVIGGPALIAAHLGDGVNFASGVPGAGVIDGAGYGSVTENRLDVLANGIVKEFPFLPSPHSGR